MKLSMLAVPLQHVGEECRFRWRRRLFRLRMRLWPAWVWLHRLSWLPVWWLRKAVPPQCLSWTPAATIRSMARYIATVEKARDRHWTEWHRCEEAERRRSMEEFGKTLTPEQRQWANNVFGVEF